MHESPETILKRINNENKKGKLKIFFSYIAGAGKTYAMLEAAQVARSQGVDVVIGYLEPHERIETSNMAKGLERIPLKEIKYHDILLKDFDLDLALERKPELILVDELAHTNPSQSRHKKRYQDIKELLNAGIDVYTTVNVQHIESLNDKVASISQVVVQERIPDYIFDEADEVEMVDIEVKDLINRLHQGKVYRKERVDKALNHFFLEKNLIALREMALRRCADRIVLKSIENGPRNEEDISTEHILVCISSSPTNAKVIRTAARMAQAFKGKFTALYVEPTDYEELSQNDLKTLRENMSLAQQFNASLDCVISDDIAQAICDYSRLSHVSKVVLGRSAIKRSIFSKPTLVESLTKKAPELDTYIIPVKIPKNYTNKKKTHLNYEFKDVCISIIWLLLATTIGFLFQLLSMNEANTMMMYIIAVILIALTTKHKIYSLIASIVSVFMFNFFFTEPYYTFHAYNPDYPVTFIVMAIVALLLSQITSRIFQDSKKNARDAYYTQILLDTNKMLQIENDAKSIIDVGCNQLRKLLDKDIIYFPVENNDIIEPVIYPIEGSNIEIDEHEQTVARWVYKNKKQAGKSTNTLPESKCRYLAIYNDQIVFGVIGIFIEDSLDAFENNILLSILGEMGLALKNDFTTKEKIKADITLKNEQTRSSLLRAISHDLRTPLTSISGNTAILLDEQMVITKEKEKVMLNHIYDDSIWLINLVENLLSVSKLEEGTMHMHQSSEMIDEILEEALKYSMRHIKNHTLKTQIDDEYMIVKADARLLIQVIINIIDNAVKYTQDDSLISVHVYKQNNQAIIDISDNGPGIDNETKKHIFEMFYTGHKVVSDSRRSLGLGLSLCKSIIKLHNGTIQVLDNHPTGTTFKIQLPIQEVDFHE